MIRSTFQELREGYAPMSNRLLLHEYRLLIKEIADTEPHTKRKGGRGEYLGESAFVRIFELKKCLAMCKEELIKRGYVIERIKL